MPFGDFKSFIFVDSAQDGYIGEVFDDVAQFSFVARTADLVQDDTGDIQGWIKA